jgi:protein TonB
MATAQAAASKNIELPHFNGDLNAYISARLRYPDDDSDGLCDSRLILKFNVCADGRLTDPAIVRKSCRQLEPEMFRILWMMPPWIPGKIDGKQVDMEFSLPIIVHIER